MKRQTAATFAAAFSLTAALGAGHAEARSQPATIGVEYFSSNCVKSHPLFPGAVYNACELQTGYYEMALVWDTATTVFTPKVVQVSARQSSSAAPIGCTARTFAWNSITPLSTINFPAFTSSTLNPTLSQVTIPNVPANAITLVTCALPTFQSGNGSRGELYGVNYNQ